MKIGYKILPMAIVALGLSSCLKDENIENLEYGMNEDAVESNRIIELPSASGTHVIAASFVPEDKDTVFNTLTVALASKEPASEDITVNLTLDNSAEIIDSWNEANDGELVGFPSDEFSIEGGLSVTIPRGSRSVTTPVKIAFNPSALLEAQYALGFRIASVDQEGYLISGNFRDMLIQFVAQSAFEAEYSFTSVITGGANTTTTEDVHMPTINANTVSKDNIGGYFSGYTEYTFNDDGTITVGAYADAAKSGSYGAEVVESSYDDNGFHVKFTILGGGYTFDETAVRN